MGPRCPSADAGSRCCRTCSTHRFAGTARRSPFDASSGARHVAAMRTLTAIGLAALSVWTVRNAPPKQDRLEPDLARAQRAVWDAWYAGDTAQVRALTPELVALGPNGSDFGDQDATIRASARFHAAGGRLLSLSFTDLHVRHYGDVAMIYSRYHTVATMGRDTMREDG